MNKYATYFALCTLFMAALFVGHEVAHCASAGHLTDCHITAHLDEHPLHASHYQAGDHAWLNPLTVVVGVGGVVVLGRSVLGGHDPET